MLTEQSLFESPSQLQPLILSTGKCHALGQNQHHPTKALRCNQLPSFRGVLELLQALLQQN
jgi:hypothetical protein